MTYHSTQDQEKSNIWSPMHLGQIYVLGKFCLNPVIPLLGMLRILVKFFTYILRTHSDTCLHLNKHSLCHLDAYELLLEAGQFTNWPYSDRSCFAWTIPRRRPTLSTAFISDLHNHS